MDVLIFVPGFVTEIVVLAVNTFLPTFSIETWFDDSDDGSTGSPHLWLQLLLLNSLGNKEFVSILVFVTISHSLGIVHKTTTFVRAEHTREHTTHVVQSVHSVQVGFVVTQVPTIVTNVPSCCWINTHTTAIVHHELS